MATDANGEEQRQESSFGKLVHFVAGPDRGPYADGELTRVLVPDERKPAMTGLDPLEVKWTVGGLLLCAAVVIGVAITTAVAHTNTTKNGHKVAVAPDAYLLAGVVLVFCIIGLLALRKRRRTLVAFTFFINGLALFLIANPLGLAFVILGGWLMVRAFRINKYGIANARAVREMAASGPRGRDRANASTKGRSTAKSGTKAPVDPSVRRPPTASKRYTPKAPPRKKVPKPTE
jgi:hypothetical protein